MKYLKKSSSSGLVLGCFVLFLSACITNEPQSQLYVLETNALPPKSQALDKNVVVIKEVVFADYISQTNLMIQTERHQLNVARYHQWNENLDVGVKRALLHDLNQDSDRLFVTSDLIHFDIKQKNLVEMHIKIEKAYPDNQGNIYLGGYYWLVGNDKKSIYSHYNFETELKEDGYAHSVSQLRFLVKRLAEDIAKKVSTFSS